jgi:hypothetical protein
MRVRGRRTGNCSGALSQLHLEVAQHLGDAGGSVGARSVAPVVSSPYVAMLLRRQMLTSHQPTTKSEDPAELGLSVVSAVPGSPTC